MLRLEYYIEKMDMFKTTPFLMIDGKKKISSKISKFFSILIYLIIIYYSNNTI